MTSKNRLIGIVCALLLTVSAWLPYTTVFKRNISLFELTSTNSIGIIVIAVGLLCGLFIALDKKVTRILSIILASLIFLLMTTVIIKFFINDRYGVSLNIGAYLIPVASLGVIVSSLMGFKKKRTVLAN